MKQNSLFQIALLCTFGALAVVGVLIFAFLQIKSTSSNIGPVTIWGTFDEPTVQKVIADMSEAHPDLKNAHYVQKDSTTYANDLTEAFASGEAPDLFFVTDDQAYSQRNRIRTIPLETLPLSQFSDVFIDAGKAFVTAEGTLALPVAADPLVMYWNKDMLQTAQFSQPPQYWDELSEIAQKVTRKTEAGVVTASTIAFGGYRNVAHAKEILTMLISQAGGSVTILDASGNLSSGLLGRVTGATQASAVPSALRFYTSFADPSQPEYTWNNSFQNSEKAFAAAQLALYIGRVSEGDMIRQANPNLNVGVAAIPQIRGSKTAVDSGRVYGLAVPKAAKNAIGAETIRALLVSADVDLALSEALHLPGAHRSVLDAQRKKPETNLAAYEALVMRNWIDPNAAKTDQIFQDMIEDTTSGALLLTEAITRAEQQINNLSD
jgi:ABC-type glycerol-3-phosphate transport system substrate-binding protein